MKKRAIIDADSMLWITAYHFREHDPSDEIHLMQAQNSLSNFLTDILNAVNAHSYIAFIGGYDKTFRYGEWSPKPYKGNRKAKPDFMDLWEEPLKSYAHTELGFVYCQQIEADDAVSITLREHKGDGILCGIDKDLLQIPGSHYNYQKGTFLEVDEEGAYYNLYYQMITGDSTDNIPGLEGTGPKGAEKILEGLPGYKMRYAVMHKYIEKYGEYEGIKRFWSSYRLIKMLTPCQAADFNFTIPAGNDFIPYVKQVVEPLAGEEESESMDSVASLLGT